MPMRLYPGLEEVQAALAARKHVGHSTRAWSSVRKLHGQRQAREAAHTTPHPCRMCGRTPPPGVRKICNKAKALNPNHRGLGLGGRGLYGFLVEAELSAYMGVGIRGTFGDI